MDPLGKKRFSTLNAKSKIGFLEERKQFLQNIENAQRTYARVAELTQTINMQWDEICAAQIERITLRKEINRQLRATDQTLVGRQSTAK